MTIIDKIEENENTGVVSVRFIKDDGTYHRTTIPLELDVETQLKIVDDHLTMMGFQPVMDIRSRLKLKQQVNLLRNKFNRKKDGE